jgi:tetratricopeptide (TPR) repeat protein
MSQVPPIVAEATAVAEAFGARLHALADGTLVITLSGRGAATDQAARAARCALALRSAQPAARVVLCTGRCEVGARVPTGEVIDRAARLSRAVADSRRAAPAVHLDEVTSALLDIRFDVRPGPHGPELHGEQEMFDTARTLLGRRTPFVGRERELAALEAVVAEARSEEVARVVLVTAPPGTGKSRLRRELLHRLRERGEPAQVWLGRGDPVRSGAPFGMIADALRSAAGLDAGEPIDASRRKLEARVARRLGPADAPRVAAFLGAIAGVPFPASVELAAARSDATLMTDQVTRAFHDLLEAECAAAPLLFVLEDLHWGDLPSTKLLDATLRGLADRPLVVLALARPEVADVFPRLWAERSLQQIRLGELPRKSGERLVREVLGARVPEARIDQIVARAAGNALYLEELIRAEANGDGDALPETVLAMVQARFATLDDEARRALRAASIFGLEFRLPGVAALLGARAEDVAVPLDELCEREIVERRSAGRIDAAFGFRHALVREAAYASLTPADRALGHRLAAAWLEEVGERDAVVLAEHAERGERLAEAARWYRRAAEQALEANDVAAALARAERGVACGAAGEDLGGLRRVQADAHGMRGESTAAEVRAIEAIELLGEGSAAWLHAVAALLAIRGRRGRFAEVISWVDRLRVLAPEARDEAEALTLALLVAAAELLIGGRPDIADPLIAHVEKRLLPRIAVAPHIVARFARARAMRHMYGGDLGGALEAFDAAARAYETIGDRRGALVQQNNAALVLLELGEDEEAERRLHDGLVLAARAGLDAEGTYGRNSLGRVLRQRGDLEGARAEAARALAEAEARNDPRLEGSVRQYRAETLAAAGDLEGAMVEMQRALGLLQSFRAVHLEAIGAHAELLLRAGRVAEALAAAREGMALLTAEGGGMAEGESRLRLSFVQALEAAGETAAAREALRAALASLFARAGRIQDARLRRSFLERVRENARLVALAAEWQEPLPGG